MSNKEVLDNILLSIKNKIQYHERRVKYWRRIFIITTMLSTILPFMSICLLPLVNNTKFFDYYTLFERVTTILLIAYIFAVNPSSNSTIHSTVVTMYSTLSSEISIHYNSDNVEDDIEHSKIIELTNKMFKDIFGIKTPPVELINVGIV